MATLVTMLLALVLFAQTSNPWDGSWKWSTYADRAAWDVLWKTQIGVYADANCGQPYFGTYCKKADGTFGFVAR